MRLPIRTKIYDPTPVRMDNSNLRKKLFKLKKIEIEISTWGVIQKISDKFWHFADTPFNIFISKNTVLKTFKD